MKKKTRNKKKEKKRNIFGLEKEIKSIKEEIVFENEKKEENYYKPVRVSNFWSNNYIGFETNDDRNKTTSAEEYLRI